MTEIKHCTVDALSSELLASREPIVLRGLVSDWPAVTAANVSNESLLSYLLNFDSGKPLTALQGAASAGGRLFYNEDLTGFNFEYVRLTLAEVVHRLLASESALMPPTLYAGSVNIDSWLPGFRADNDLPLDAQNPLASFWLGNRSRIAAHFDFPSNIACVVAGKRRVTLFPPDQLENLYVGPLDFNPAGQAISLVDFEEPDYETFPLFRKAMQVAEVVELEPGDALLIPSMWWHHIDALGAVNLLVNYWWRSTPGFMGPPLNVLQHAILGLRDLPVEQRAVWKQIFDYYVFDPKPENMAHIPGHARGVLNPIDEETALKLRALLRDNLT